MYGVNINYLSSSSIRKNRKHKSRQGIIKDKGLNDIDKDHPHPNPKLSQSDISETDSKFENQYNQRRKRSRQEKEVQSRSLLSSKLDQAPIIPEQPEGLGSRERTRKEVRNQKAYLSGTLSRKAKENATRGGSNPSIKLFFKSLESTKADDAIQKKSQDLNTPIILGNRKSND